MRRTEPDVTVQILIAAAARRCHGVAAPALNFFGDALRRVGRICFVDVGHEGVGAFAAGEDALLRDKLTLCARSSSPRILHFSNGPFKSHRKRAPIFQVSSQVVREELGREFSQEVAFRPVYPDCSGRCAEIRTAFSARRMTAWLLRPLGGSRRRRADRPGGRFRRHRSQP
jgi:pyruvate dehydrogenase (quinone)